MRLAAILDRSQQKRKLAALNSRVPHRTFYNQLAKFGVELKNKTSVEARSVKRLPVATYFDISVRIKIVVGAILQLGFNNNMATRSTKSLGLPFSETTARLVKSKQP
jgi:hypothetical protein